MTPAQASDILRRLAAGEHFDLKLERDARIVVRPARSIRKHGLPALPEGCEWHRPAPGWIDCRRARA